MSAPTALMPRTPVPPGSWRPRRGLGGPRGIGARSPNHQRYPGVAQSQDQDQTRPVKQALNPSRMSRTLVVQHVLSLYIDRSMGRIPERYETAGQPGSEQSHGSAARSGDSLTCPAWWVPVVVHTRPLPLPAFQPRDLRKDTDSGFTAGSRLIAKSRVHYMGVRPLNVRGLDLGRPLANNFAKCIA